MDMANIGYSDIRSVHFRPFGLVSRDTHPESEEYIAVPRKSFRLSLRL